MDRQWSTEAVLARESKLQSEFRWHSARGRSGLSWHGGNGILPWEAEGAYSASWHVARYFIFFVSVRDAFIGVVLNKVSESYEGREQDSSGYPVMLF
eukprot:10775756-Karenia_brevis.AAC.1